MEQCECGHPQGRHVYGAQWCTHATKAPGEGWKSCHCLQYDKEEPQKGLHDQPTSERLAEDEN